MMAPPTQRPNVYNSKLPDPKGHQQDSLRYLAEVLSIISWKDYNLVKTQVKSGLAKAILEQNITESTVWVINLHKYIILYGLNFSRADHIYLIKVYFKWIPFLLLSNLFSARLFSASSPPKMSSRISWTSLPRWDTFDTVIGQQLFGSLRQTLRRFCQPCWKRSSLYLGRRCNLTGGHSLNFSRSPSWSLTTTTITSFYFAALGRLESRSARIAEISSGLQGADQSCYQGDQSSRILLTDLSLKIPKVSRGYFTDESTSEMLAKWTHMLCPADRCLSCA